MWHAGYLVAPLYGRLKPDRIFNSGNLSHLDPGHLVCDQQYGRPYIWPCCTKRRSSWGMRYTTHLMVNCCDGKVFCFAMSNTQSSWLQWPRGLRRRSAAACLLRLWVRIRPGAWMLVCCECRVLSGSGLCDGLITRPEEF
jgi:hypothetical protein